MGAIGEAIIAYAQPLLDQTDGSIEQMNKAMTISQLCWNLALRPEGERAQMLGEMRPSLQMDEDQFDEFRRSIIDPMIRRHHDVPINASAGFSCPFAKWSPTARAPESGGRRSLPWNRPVRTVSL